MDLIFVLILKAALKVQTLHSGRSSSCEDLKMRFTMIMIGMRVMMVEDNEDDG